MKTIRSRILLIALLAAASVLSLVPRSVTERAYDPESGQVVETTTRRVPIDLGLDLRGGTHLALEIDESKAEVADCADAVARAERVIRNRMSEFGTTEPVVQTSGECRLIVELPGERDPARARSVVQRTAYLEFRLVDSRDRADVLGRAVAEATGEPGALIRGDLPGEYLVPDRLVGRVQEALETDARGRVPRSLEIRWGTAVTTLRGEVHRPFYLLDSRALVTGEELLGATTARDPMTSRPQVRFELTRAAGRAFGQATGRHVGEYMAILLDGRVQGRPAVIRDRIGSSGSIELPGRTMEEAGDLALSLRSGALPVPLRVVTERTVGPSLGSDSIEAGVRTSVLAVAFVVLVMTAYYRFSGVLAVGALGLYLLYSLGGLAVFGFTLTLPGVAGFALAIGMAVDANVLIFERIREELGLGRSVRLAVDRGFRHAMSAIVDSNVTTALTALILHLVGTDAVKGFAVTLLIGLCASMFAAIFVTRTLFLMWLRRRGGSATLKYRTVRPLTDARYDFMRFRRWVLGVSGVLAVAGLLLFAARGVSYGIDFTGGTLVQVRTEAPASAGAIRSAFSASPLGDAEIQSFGSDRDFIVRTRLEGSAADGAGNAAEEEARDALDVALGPDAYEVVKTEKVGPKVGSELQEKAAAAIGASFATTLAYLAVRFERRFGLAAVLATAHDILATLAFISVTDLEVSLVTVAGVLTVIGYSLNDTIVIFDRVRENLARSSGGRFRDVLNASINETLPRTVLTACTTLVAALLLAAFAGPVVRPLGLVMSFGIVVGTMSSIFVASPVLLWLRTRGGEG
ncbi:MAG: protein translocase subunit SecD [Gemmatimonadota bacterium]|jgi:SecD/SecF fusion protein